MLPINKLIKSIIVCTMMFVMARTTVQAQTTQPIWWFGVTGAANFNFYDGTTQRLNNSLIVPTAFHKGFGVRPFGAVLLEYRPAGLWGGMLNVGYDGRGAKFDNVVAPCNCPATLETNTSYVTIEPSLRFSPGASNFYIFAGPRVAFNIQRDFSYTQLKQPNTDDQLSAMKKSIISGQVGIGYEIPLSSPKSTTKINLSPFISYQPYFGQEPRNIESWTVTTVRAGISLKFGKASKAVITDAPPVAAIPERDVMFTVREPKAIALNRKVSETLPLRNSVFFDQGSTQVPSRYVVLSKDQASNFKEVQLQNEQSDNMVGRSARQLSVYHNILNILGDRLRSNPGASIYLSGASGNGPADGKACAESVKQYLVSVFGIDAANINTQGRTKPVIPSEQPGGTKELDLLRAGDRRVDIESNSPALLMEVGGGMMKPVLITSTIVDPLDSHVVYNVAGAKDVLKSWSIDVADEQGVVKHFGPFTNEQESTPGAVILGDRADGNYKVTMTGETKTGLMVKKESSVHLVKQNDTPEKGLRYSILFDFNKANSIASYNKFLTDVVSPLITDGATVIVHGHTDIIGDESYNLKLSDSRARQTQKVIEGALAKAGKSNVKFETFGFGEDVQHAPFENNLPEERFYNRTVIIDIVPVK